MRLVFTLVMACCLSSPVFAQGSSGAGGGAGSNSGTATGGSAGSPAASGESGVAPGTGGTGVAAPTGRRQPVRADIPQTPPDRTQQLQDEKNAEGDRVVKGICSNCGVK